MRNLGLEIKLAVRALLQTPLFTSVIVLSLALGIGANTAIFTFADQLLLRLLPVAKPKELVQFNIAGGRVGTGYGRYGLSYPLYKDLRDKNEVFSGLIASYSHPASVRVNGVAQMMQAELVSGNYFNVLGVRAEAGRVLQPGDDVTIDAHPVAVLSYTAWRDRFGSDPTVVGRTIHINNRAFTVVGVSEKNFDGLDIGSAPAVRVPLMMKRTMTPTWDAMNDRETHWVQIFGRLKPGMSVEQARASLQVLRRTIAEEEVKGAWWSNAPAEGRTFYVRQAVELLPASKGQSFLRRQYEAPLMVLMAMVAVVLLIACANVANLLLARAVQRQREIAVRFSIGATRGQVARLLLIESVALALMGGVAGVLLSVWGCEYMLQFVRAAGQSTLTLTATPDWRVLTFTVSLSVLTGVLFGMAPVWQSTGVDLADAMKSQANSVSAGASHVRLRRLLVAGQIALSVMLLCGAALFMRSLGNLRDVNPGINVDRIIAFAVDPTMSGYKPEQTIGFYSEMYRRLAQIPGVQAVSGAGNRMLSNDDWNWTIKPEGWNSTKASDGNVLFNPVGPGYFHALGLSMRAGREFAASDGPQRKIAVVNEAFARKFFGGANPVGRRLATEVNDNPRYDVEIVGMVPDAKYTNLRESNEPQLFMPYMMWPDRTGRLNVLVRFRGEPDVVQQEIRRVVRQQDPSVPVYAMRTMAEQVEQSLANERLIAGLAAGFGVLATVLAAIGLYGVLAFQVARRGREIGIRVAMGASGRIIIGMVLREVGVLLLLGGAVGLGAGLSVTHLVRAQLYGVSPQDPVSFGGALGALALIAAMAAALPAWRAAKTDPIQVLRYE